MTLVGALPGRAFLRRSALAALLWSAAGPLAPAQRDEPEPPPVLTRLRDVDVGRTPSELHFGQKSGDLFVACAYDSAFRRLDHKTQASTGWWRFSPLSPLGFAVPRDERSVVFANFAADTLCWLDLKSGEVDEAVQLEFKPVQVQVSPKGDLAAVACDRAQTVYFVDLRRRRVKGEGVVLNGAPHGLVFDARGSVLYVACGEPTPSLARIHVSSGGLGFWEAPIRSGSEICLSRDGKQVLASSSRGSGALLVLNAAGGSSLDPGSGDVVVKTVPLPVKTSGIQPLRKGKSLALLAPLAHELVVLDAESFEIQQRIATGKQPYDLELSRDGSTLVVANRSGGTVTFYSVAE